MVEGSAGAMPTAQGEGPAAGLHTGPRGVTLTLSPEQIGMAATALVVFLGVAVIGPGIAALRRPKRPSLGDRARRAGQDARLRAEVAGARAGKRVRRLGGTFRA